MDGLQQWIEGLNGLQLFGVITGIASIASTAITFGLNVLMKRADQPRAEWRISKAQTQWVVHETGNALLHHGCPEMEPQLSVYIVNVGTAPARNIHAFASGAGFKHSDAEATVDVGEGFWITAECYPASWEYAHLVLVWSENRMIQAKSIQRYTWINFQDVGEAPFPENELGKPTRPERQSELLARRNPDWPHQERCIPPAKHLIARLRAERMIRSKTATHR